MLSNIGAIRLWRSHPISYFTQMRGMKAMSVHVLSLQELQRSVAAFSKYRKNEEK